MGNFEATVKAVEHIDQQIEQLYREVIVKRNGTLFITADHGNAESMFNETTQQKNKAHTTNLVPFYAINSNVYLKKCMDLKM